MGYCQIKIGIVIPARLESERLPRKVLKMSSGLPMIEHVWRRAQLTNPVIETVIATDSEEIKKVCENFGAKCYITSKNHPNGLSRISEISSRLNWDFYIVLQADEILIDIKLRLIAIRKNPKDSGISEPRLLPIKYLLTAIDLHTQLLRQDVMCQS